MVINNRIKFFSFYGCMEQGQRRENSPAADTKVDYIVNVLNRLGYSVDIISRASSAELYFLSSTVKIKGVNSYRYFASFGKTKSSLRIVYRWFMELQFFFWCLLNLRKGEQVIVYHSLGYDSTFIKLKYLRKIRIIGDIEEIYQDVHKQRPSKKRNEYRFIQKCDKLMFSNTILNERFNHSNRPYIVCHGIYKAQRKITEKYNDGKIHLLYSGTYDPVKGGAIASIKMAEYLPEKYHLHITGFGNDQALKEELKRVKFLTKCAITYHGYLEEEEFISLMQSCHIGLCTQDPTNKLNFTSFPSKILNYISNGLVVITGRNRVIEDSAVGKFVHYYDVQNPKDISIAVMQIQLTDESIGKELLELLDKKFSESLNCLLKIKV